MLTKYHSNTFIPELVKVSKMLAQRHHFEYSCSDEAGRLYLLVKSHMEKFLKSGQAMA